MRPLAFTFHGLGEPHSGVAADERPYWLPLPRFAGIMERIAASGRADSVIVTFDDGNKSDLAGAELLARHGLRGYSFVLAGRLGQEHYLGRGDLAQLAGAGLTVGLHGRHHVDWRRLDDAALADETIGARAELADALGAPVDEVAVPFGAYDGRVMRHLRAAGFAHVHTSDRGFYDPAARIWNRNTLRSDTPDTEIAALLEGRMALARRLRGGARRWLRRTWR